MKYFNSISLFSALIMMTSCGKEYLDKKPDKSLLVPLKLSEFRALLDNSSIMNREPSFGIIAADEYTISDNGLNALPTAPERNSYYWAIDVYEGARVSDWNLPYQQVFYTNVVLDGLKSLEDKEGGTEEYRQVKGSALFFRAFSFYNLAQLFCRPYSSSAAADPGIPLRLSADVNEPGNRATVEETYSRILLDLSEAEALLPNTAAYKSRPSKWAAYALKARVYLSMEDYVKALEYAGKALEVRNKLIDYNSLSTTAARPFPEPLPNGNDEVIFHMDPILYSFLTSSLTVIAPALYDLYSENDLRKKLFFNRSSAGKVTLKSTYTGLTTDEMYLIKAECQARNGNIPAALETLNALLIKRYKTGTFAPLAASSEEGLLRLLIAERRKELFNRALRWTDLRRFNRDPRFAVTLMRTVNGKSYTLPPNDNRYVFPIPDDEIRASGAEQNPR